MNCKSIGQLLLICSLFSICLPAPKLLLVETEDGEGAEGKVGVEDEKEGGDGDGVDYKG